MMENNNDCSENNNNISKYLFPESITYKYTE